MLRLKPFRLKDETITVARYSLCFQVPTPSNSQGCIMSELIKFPKIETKSLTKVNSFLLALLVTKCKMPKEIKKKEKDFIQSLLNTA